ncbi:MAG: hypothetical protein QW324_06770 [Thermofilaceae archaeon]
MKRWLLLLLPAVLAALLFYRGYRVEHREERAHVVSVAAYGYITVTVGGATVYNGEMHSFTEDGAALWAFLMTRAADPTIGCAVHPTRMRVGHSLGTSDSTLSKGYGFNSTHMWFSFNGSFVAESDLTLKWVGLVQTLGDCSEVVVTNDTLPSIRVPRGSVYSVAIAIYWRDYGALTENFAKHFYTLSPEAPGVLLSGFRRDGGTYRFGTFDLDSSGTPRYFFYPWLAGAGLLGTRMYLIVSNRSNPPPPSRTDYDMPEVARWPVGYSYERGVIIIYGVVGVEATEVGLVARSLDIERLGSEGVPDSEILLMRWVPAQPLKPGTVVRLVLTPP